MIFSRARRFTVSLPPAEAARLKAFDNKTEGRTPGPLGGLTFVRKGDKFVVEDWTRMFLQGLVTTRGTVTWSDDDEVEVSIKNHGLWLPYLLIAGGLLCGAMTMRDGLGALVLGAVLVAAGWFCIPGGELRRNALDATEQVLRNEITGEWSAS